MRSTSNMKVMKFGGISLGTSEAIQKVKDIIGVEQQPVIIVVSALYGVTEQLLQAADYALNDDKSYEMIFDILKKRHKEIVEETIASEKLKTDLNEEMQPLFEDLKNILRGVYLIGDLSQKTSDKIVSYGERLSSLILSKIIPDAHLFDSTQFIKTTKQFNKHIPDIPLSNQLIKEQFKNINGVAIVPGFISSSKDEDDITNLGRGGSDYTASIIAAALNASVLEIWTKNYSIGLRYRRVVVYRSH